MNIKQLIEQGAWIEVTTDRGRRCPVLLEDILAEAVADKLPPDPPAADRQVIDFGQIKVVDGQDPATKGRGWNDSFRKWGVRTLEDNEDVGTKMFVDGVTHVIAENDLVLRAEPHNGATFAGMISAEDILAMRYGTIELEFRINNISKGHHIAAWLLPINGAWPPEIDLFEFVNTADRIYLNSHHEGQRERVPLTELPLRDPNGWHKVKLEWTPDRLAWFLDDEPRPQREVRNHDMHAPMYPLVSWEIGSKWPGKVDRTTRWPASITLRRMTITGPE